MAETWTVKPAGGGDYSDLATAETAKNTNLSGRGVVGLECYGGGDLGIVTVDGGTNQDASNYLRIYAAAGEEHDGKTTSDDGAYVNGVSADYGFRLLDPYVRVEGMRYQYVSSAGTDTYGGYTNANNCVFDSCVFVFSGGVAGNSARGIRNQGGTGFTIKNCSFYENYSVGAGIAIQSFGTTTVINCSAYGFASFGFEGNNVSTITNCVFLDCGTCFYTYSGTHTWTYNCSSDTTADDKGGAGNLISKTASNQWTSVGSDHSVKDTDADIYHAGVNVGLSTDIIGTTWDNPPSIGAFELAGGGGGTTKKRAVSAFAAFLARKG